MVRGEHSHRRVATLCEHSVYESRWRSHLHTPIPVRLFEPKYNPALHPMRKLMPTSGNLLVQPCRQEAKIQPSHLAADFDWLELHDVTNITAYFGQAVLAILTMMMGSATDDAFASLMATPLVAGYINNVQPKDPLSLSPHLDALFLNTHSKTQPHDLSPRQRLFRHS
jgi:hypothetical protein